MAILDFSKAFDTMPHKRLLGKLSFYGIIIIKGPILRWIEAFLVDRIQGVVVEGCRPYRSPLVGSSLVSLREQCWGPYCSCYT